ncbi:hypothetical protein [Aliidiomarina sanyensis]|uniref:DUF4287 domain-containing protein n=1 Tax=Aliidiomarina sanyensis TaxID=1249555 RepID=A0A432WKD9_9GAMM|nr:hypothetical protein [Aliidiomarina sanyensis]RUO34270.1 hypothetical protein CWE11_05960 [Aliidiomarina sanyensis]
MAHAVSNRSIEAATGHTWQHWCEVLDRAGARYLEHKEIAEYLLNQESLPAWWAQTLAVNYEQEIGRRVPGQDCSGKFRVSVSKTLSGSMDEALSTWQKLMKTRGQFSDVMISRGPDTSTTEKWRYWRCGLADGSSISVNIYQKSPDKASLTVEHAKLESEAHVEHWRAFWKGELSGL